MSTNRITPSSPRLASLLGDVSKGNIKIPVFQRDYVWDDEQIMNLLDSIYQGYPVGSILLWSTKNRLDHEKNVGGFKLPDTPADYPVQYVLDGQQRLTTLYGVFNSDAATANAELANRFNVVFVPSTKEFVHSSGAGAHPHINLRDLLDTTKLLPALAQFAPEQQSVIAAAVERFKDYEFPVVTIKDRSNREVCSIFQRINSSGTSLSTLELLSAWTWSEQFDLREQIQSLLERLSDKGYEDLDKTEVMRCLTAIALDAIDPELLVDVKPDTLVASMSKLKEAMFAAIDFLESDIHIKNIIFLPFPIMIVPLVRFFATTLKPNAAQRSNLKKWFWHCCFTQRYRAGTNRLVKEDIERMKQLADGKPVFDGLPSKVDPDTFTKTWRINSAAAKAFICLLAQLKPKSFLNGGEINLGESLSAYNARQFHHIYPKAFLGKSSIGFHEANVIANICMLSASDNNAIGDKAPAVYFAEMPVECRDEAMDRALIPAEYRNGDKTYADFVRVRSAEIASIASRLITAGSI